MMTVSTNHRLCTNKGCGKSFVEEENSDTACEFHPGAPVFHEGLKGWSCCSKKVIDFNDFLKIPGCSVGAHSIAAPTNNSAAPSPNANPAPAKAAGPTSVVDGKEVYGAAPAAASTPAKSATSTVAAPPKVEIKEEDLHDSLDAVISVGTACKRKGCTHSFTGPESKEDTCVFHSGTPIFHEGSKGWTCCPRKVLEFDEFMKIKGCKSGKHRFTDAGAAVEEKVECRHDWYQTPSRVIVSIFAKKVDKTKTTITFGEQSMTVKARFQDGKYYELDTPLNQPIKPEECKYMVLSTKIEITLKKANGISWPALEPAEGVVSWTTFGVTGGVGTVGSKEAIIAQDAPLHLLKK